MIQHYQGYAIIATRWFFFTQAEIINDSFIKISDICFFLVCFHPFRPEDMNINYLYCQTILYPIHSDVLTCLEPVLLNIV